MRHATVLADAMRAAVSMHNHYYGAISRICEVRCKANGIARLLGVTTPIKITEPQDQNTFTLELFLHRELITISPS